MTTRETRPPSPRDILGRRSHRPYPVPGGAWVGLQRWRDVLFAHWRVPAQSIEALLPSGLHLDRYRGEAWLGIVAFRIRLRPRALPGLSFEEVNVRTYVHDGSRPGVYFFSLDASSRLAVAGARRLLNLPYFSASILMAAHGPITEFSSTRADRVTGLTARYWGTGQARAARPGSLEHFLTERYCLYAVHRWLGLYRLEIHHPPWPLQPGSVDVRANTLADALDVELDRSPLVHVAASQDVATWAPARLPARAAPGPLRRRRAVPVRAAGA